MPRARVAEVLGRRLPADDNDRPRACRSRRASDLRLATVGAELALDDADLAAVFRRRAPRPADELARTVVAIAPVEGLGSRAAARSAEPRCPAARSPWRSKPGRCLGRGRSVTTGDVPPSPAADARRRAAFAIEHGLLPRRSTAVVPRLGRRHDPASDRQPGGSRCRQQQDDADDGPPSQRYAASAVVDIAAILADCPGRGMERGRHFPSVPRSHLARSSGPRCGEASASDRRAGVRRAGHHRYRPSGRRRGARCLRGARWWSVRRRGAPPLDVRRRRPGRALPALRGHGQVHRGRTG